MNRPWREHAMTNMHESVGIRSGSVPDSVIGGGQKGGKSYTWFNHAGAASYKAEFLFRSKIIVIIN